MLSLSKLFSVAKRTNSVCSTVPLVPLFSHPQTLVLPEFPVTIIASSTVEISVLPSVVTLKLLKKFETPAEEV